MRKILLIAFALLIALTVVLGAVSLNALNRLDVISNHLIEDLEMDMLIDERINDHLHWMSDLADSIILGEQFKGELDYHKCALAKWYREFKMENGQAMQVHALFNEPHKKIHEIASRISPLAVKGDKQLAFDMYEKELKPAAAQMESVAGQLQAIVMGEIEALKKEHDIVDIRSRTMIVSTTAGILIISVIIAILATIAISKIIARLSNATSQITSASSEILSAAQEQASGAREQSSAVSETTSAAKELSTTSEQVGQSIKRVSDAASHALAGMAKIKEAITKTGLLITSLGEKSQKIGKITELIDDVSDQTNLLAVNASIEAARAGEQGRGFTVVADEIRKLADSSAKSTKDITGLIELIQHEMSNSVMAMEQSVTSVDEEAKLAHETAERSKEIAMSVNQQISGSKQIAEAMNNIDEAMKQIAAGAQQSQAAVKQLNGLADELKKLAVQLR